MVRPRAGNAGAPRLLRRGSPSHARGRSARRRLAPPLAVRVVPVLPLLPRRGRGDELGLAPPVPLGPRPPVPPRGPLERGSTGRDPRRPRPPPRAERRDHDLLARRLAPEPGSGLRAGAGGPPDRRRGVARGGLDRVPAVRGPPARADPAGGPDHGPDLRGRPEPVRRKPRLRLALGDPGLRGRTPRRLPGCRGRVPPRPLRPPPGRPSPQRGAGVGRPGLAPGLRLRPVRARPAQPPPPRGRRRPRARADGARPPLPLPGPGARRGGPSPRGRGPLPRDRADPRAPADGRAPRPGRVRPPRGRGRAGLLLRLPARPRLLVRPLEPTQERPGPRRMGGRETCAHRAGGARARAAGPGRLVRRGRDQTDPRGPGALRLSPEVPVPRAVRPCCARALAARVHRPLRDLSERDRTP